MGTRLFRMDPKAFKFKVKNHRDHKEQSFRVNFFLLGYVLHSALDARINPPPLCPPVRDFLCGDYFTPKSIAVFIPATMALTWIRSVAPMLRRCSIVARRSRIVILVCGESSRS